jgi:methionyl-tRNA formyltransferase
MRIAFAGTPEFSVAALDALRAAGHQIVGVFTQPDRPAGRGQKLKPSPVAARAEALHLPTFKPVKMNAEAQDDLRMLRAELMVVVAYGLILPAAALGIPRHGCFNIHASLLPRWRGAAPIQRAILAGDAETGITIMRMDAGLDTGPMLLKESLPIAPTTNAADLHEALAAMGARMIVQAAAQIASDELREQVQSIDGVTYAKKISKDEARLDWAQPAEELARRVRGYNPVPVAWSELGSQRVRVYAAHAEVREATDEAGIIIGADEHGIRVACGQGVLNLQSLQWAGGRILSAAEAVRGKELVGQRFR